MYRASESESGLNEDRFSSFTNVFHRIRDSNYATYLCINWKYDCFEFFFIKFLLVRDFPISSAQEEKRFFAYKEHSHTLFFSILRTPTYYWRFTMYVWISFQIELIEILPFLCRLLLDMSRSMTELSECTCFVESLKQFQLYNWVID